MKRTLAIVTAALLASCASYFLKGAKEYRGGPPPGSIASFKAPTCKAADGQKMAGPTGTYYLAKTMRGPALYELDASGEGSAITNYWRDAQGHHFAAYVRGHQAWEYVLPDDRSKPGVRKVFLQYQVEKAPGGFRISGEPVATCQLINPQATASAAPANTTPAPATAATPPAPAPVAAPPPSAGAPPAPAAAAEPNAADAGASPDAAGPALARPSKMLCVPGATQVCVGSGGCRGGQYCLANGSGYSPCDCGGNKK